MDVTVLAYVCDDCGLLVYDAETVMVDGQPVQLCETCRDGV